MENNYITKYPFTCIDLTNSNPYRDNSKFSVLETVASGWVKIAIDMCEEINALIANDPDAFKDYNIVDIKEKLGFMCIYDYGAPSKYADMLRKIYDKYETKSFSTCIRCGNKSTKLVKSVPMCNKCSKELHNS